MEYTDVRLKFCTLENYIMLTNVTSINLIFREERKSLWLKYSLLLQSNLSSLSESMYNRNCYEIKISKLCVNEVCMLRCFFLDT